MASKMNNLTKKLIAAGVAVGIGAAGYFIGYNQGIKKVLHDLGDPGLSSMQVGYKDENGDIEGKLSFMHLDRKGEWKTKFVFPFIQRAQSRLYYAELIPEGYYKKIRLSDGEGTYVKLKFP